MCVCVWVSKADWCNQGFEYISHVPHFLLWDIALSNTHTHPHPHSKPQHFSHWPPPTDYTSPQCGGIPRTPQLMELTHTYTCTQACWPPFITLAVEQSQRPHKLQLEILMTVTCTHVHTRSSLVKATIHQLSYHHPELPQLKIYCLAHVCVCERETIYHFYKPEHHRSPQSLLLRWNRVRTKASSF